MNPELVIIKVPYHGQHFYAVYEQHGMDLRLRSGPMPILSARTARRRAAELRAQQAQ